jgi:hypothetical protein
MPTDRQAPPVTISQRSLASGDPLQIVASNIAFVDALCDVAHLELAELAPNAVASYCVDYYRSQLDQGGFAQFVRDSRWDPEVIDAVRRGLALIGAHRHLIAFEAGAALVDQLDPETRSAVAGGGPLDEATGDAMALIDTRYDWAADQEDLLWLNAAWLSQLPELVTALTDEAFRAAVDRAAAAVPDQHERTARALAAEPPPLKIIRALCARAGHRFLGLLDGEPEDGAAPLPFVTDHGSFVLVLRDGRAQMLPDPGSEPAGTPTPPDAAGAGDPAEPLAELSAPELATLT